MAISEIQEEPAPIMPRPPRSPEIQELPPDSPVAGLRKSTTTPKSKPPSPQPGCWGGGRWFGFPLRRSAAATPVEEPDAPKRCVGRTRGLSWATKMTIGRRRTMEDFHTTLRGFMRLSCPEFGGCAAHDSGCSPAPEPEPVHYFGVFDGHRGDEIWKKKFILKEAEKHTKKEIVKNDRSFGRSTKTTVSLRVLIVAYYKPSICHRGDVVGEFCANMLHHMVIEEREKQASEEVVEWHETWKIAFSRAFERADDTVKDSSLAARFTGSTASVVVLSPCQIIASSCGDSRAILCRSNEVIQLTVDHKPYKKEEAKRIKKSGGKILKNNGLRVEGVLSMTRAIGDHDLKQYVISTPDVSCTRRSDDDEFLIIATDGLWDVISNQKVAKVVRKKLRQYRPSPASDSIPAAAIAEELVYKALAKNSMDNITVIVVDLKPLSRRKNDQARSAESRP